MKELHAAKLTGGGFIVVVNFKESRVFPTDAVDVNCTGNRRSLLEKKKCLLGSRSVGSLHRNA